MLRCEFFEKIRSLKNFEVRIGEEHYYIEDRQTKDSVAFVHKDYEGFFIKTKEVSTNEYMQLVNAVIDFGTTPSDERDLYILSLPDCFDGLFRFLCLDEESGKYVLADFYSMDGKKFKFTEKEMKKMPFFIGSFDVKRADLISM